MGIKELQAFYKGKKIFLTGGTGFKGSWLALWLESLGAKVVIYSLPPPTEPSLFVLSGLQQSSNWIQGDITELEPMAKAMVDVNPDLIFHLAAQPLVRESFRNPVSTYATNVMGTVNVLEAARNLTALRGIVVVTTDKCYENREWVWGYREDEPMGGYDPYSSSKGCAELVVSAYRRSFFNNDKYGTDHHVALASARAGNVIGGGDYASERLVPDIIRAFERQERVLIRNPRAIRPWQHVLEPLSGYLILGKALYEKGPSYAEAWNFGPKDDDAKPVEWIVSYLCKHFPHSKGFEIETSIQPHEAHYLKLDCSKAINRLDWKPIWSLEKSLEKIIEWSLFTGSSYRELVFKQITAYQESL